MKFLKTAFVAVLMLLVLTSSSFAAGTVKQVVTPSGLALAVSAENENTDVIFEGFQFDLRIFTPEFKDAVRVPGKTTSIMVVKDGKVAEIVAEKAADYAEVPAIPSNGYLVVGSGAGSNFLKNFQVGDAVTIKEKDAQAPSPAPTVAVTLSGNSRDISGMDKGREAQQLILFTPDFGSHTYTNVYGVEIAIEDGVVVKKRAYGSDELFAIPENGYVLSGHGGSGTWVDSVKVGDLVELQ